MKETILDDESFKGKIWNEMWVLVENVESVKSERGVVADDKEWHELEALGCVAVNEGEKGRLLPSLESETKTQTWRRLYVLAWGATAREPCWTLPCFTTIDSRSLAYQCPGRFGFGSQWIMELEQTKVPGGGRHEDGCGHVRRAMRKVTWKQDDGTLGEAFGEGGCGEEC